MFCKLKITSKTHCHMELKTSYIVNLFPSHKPIPPSLFPFPNESLKSLRAEPMMHLFSTDPYIMAMKIRGPLSYLMNG